MKAFCYDESNFPKGSAPAKDAGWPRGLPGLAGDALEAASNGGKSWRINGWFTGELWDQWFMKMFFFFFFSYGK